MASVMDPALDALIGSRIAGEPPNAEGDARPLDGSNKF
jgi:hypothetical protein